VRRADKAAQAPWHPSGRAGALCGGAPPPGAAEGCRSRPIGAAAAAERNHGLRARGDRARAASQTWLRLRATSVIRLVRLLSADKRGTRAKCGATSALRVLCVCDVFVCDALRCCPM